MKTDLFIKGVLVLLLAMLAGCGIMPFKAYTNKPLAQQATPSLNKQASFELRDTREKPDASGQLVDCNPKKAKDVLVLLSMSGGGSRAALLSALSMFELQEMTLPNGSNLLAEVDLMSSVSGGSLAAAYYASSADPQTPGAADGCGASVSGRLWQRSIVAEAMANNYIGRWIGNWFWPDNIVLYWLSSYDRTDMMAQTFADNLFDTRVSGRDLRFADLNPSRPNLVVNATQGSGRRLGSGQSNGFGQPFTFTAEDFGRLCSSLDSYELSRAVMASATFPGVFNFMTLRRYCDSPRRRYLHVFDGGNSDNLGLSSIKRLIWRLYEQDKLSHYRKIIVILLDAHTVPSGVDEAQNDPRHWYDYVVDTNIAASSDSLLERNRDNLLSEFESKTLFPYGVGNARPVRQGVRTMTVESQSITDCIKFFSWLPQAQAHDTCRPDNTDWAGLNSSIQQRLEFRHVSFDLVVDADLKRQINNIATDFRLSSAPDVSTTLTPAEAIACAVPTLFGRASLCKYAGNDITYTVSDGVADYWEGVKQIFAGQSK